MFDKLKKSIRQFGKDERGVTAVEYAVIAVAMSGILLTIFNNGVIKNSLTKAAASIESNLGAASDTKTTGKTTGKKTN
ncbi:Flp family type IVb pilin [uncultured Photobacterium sp.]|uniref:Flp family type IVb pilin n=1 Tax=uncultured Photobacterium sp. TaxID=173973 RepID=UPI00261A8CDA|nr:Flp family type IVb pilin [uncultured Photobacterium sp.]